MKTRERLILTVVGIFALGTALLGYSGLYRAIVPRPDRELELECYRVIDAAQLWYVRPEAYGGGDRSFIGLDFHVIGLSDKPGAVTWRGEHGGYAIENLRTDAFDLEAVSPDGTRLEARDIGFDTRPVLVKKRRER